MVNNDRYTSNYDIKEFIINQMAPKYFNMDGIDKSNVSIFGFLSDSMAGITEDLTNVISVYGREIIPNLATLPQSIYAYAGSYNIDELFARPAEVHAMIFVSENDVNKYGTPHVNFKEFFLDSAFKLDVGGISYTLDYDIKIVSKKYRDDMIYSANYEVDFTNSLSDINNPYIQIKQVKYANTTYLGLVVKLRRVDVTNQDEILISNDNINLPKVLVPYDNQLANFEVLYREPGKSEYIQLTKRFYRSAPLETPFCYYRFLNDGLFEITFSSFDNKFKPKFNSELLIKVYTCNGSSDNKPLYQGNDITAIPTSNVYPYNDGLLMLGSVRSAVVGGKDKPNLEEIQDMYLDKMVTIDSYTTDNDLQIYFKDIEKRLGNKVLFVKKRDDVFDRLFTSFTIVKDIYGEIYPTNTLHLQISPDDLIETTIKSSIFKPGQLFAYDGKSKDTVVLIDKAEVNEHEFVYTLPFLTYVQKSPENVGFFINNIDDNITLDYSFINDESYLQFMITNLFVYRDAVNGDDSYVMKITVTPTVDNHDDIVDPETGLDNGILSLRGTFLTDSRSPICHVNFNMVQYDLEEDTYTFEYVLKTDDFVNMDGEFRVLDVIDHTSNNIMDRLIKMSSNFEISTYFKYGDISMRHRYNIQDDEQQFVLTNKYSTDDNDKINFITPITNMRCNMSFLDNNQGGYNIRLNHVPFIKYDIINNKKSFAYFMENIKDQYNIVKGLMTNITSSFSIDMKFYNTYGRSNNFTISDKRETINRVNCSIEFILYTQLSVNIDELVTNVKKFIKGYIEGINNKGYNGIYISNLIKLIESQFSEIDYLKFISINGYDSLVQVVENNVLDITTMNKDDLRSYIPEFLTLDLANIKIDIVDRQKTNY